MMSIQAGGSRWTVHEDASEVRFCEDGEQYVDLVFVPDGDEAEMVELRWVPRPGHITAGQARRLFELAGERRWRDRRTERIYRIFLEDDGAVDFDDAAGPERAMRVRFENGSRELTTRYDLGHALGMATAGELTALLDRAAARG